MGSIACPEHLDSQPTKVLCERGERVLALNTGKEDGDKGSSAGHVEPEKCRIDSRELLQGCKHEGRVARTKRNSRVFLTCGFPRLGCACSTHAA